MLACFAIDPAPEPPAHMPASVYLGLLEDLASLKIRLLGLILHLSPPKGQLMTTADATLMQHVIRLLHTAPVSTHNSKDLLVFCRHMFSKFRKLDAAEPVVQYVQQNLLAVAGGGRLFSRQRSSAQRVLAHTLFQELLGGCIANVPLATLDELLDVFAAELLNGNLPVPVHVKSIDGLRLIQEHLCLVAKDNGNMAAADAAVRSSDAQLRKMLGKSLTAVLHKLEQQAAAVRPPRPLRAWRVTATP